MDVRGHDGKQLVHFHQLRNEATRIDLFEELSHTALAALRSFFRRLGAPHLLDENILPTMQEGDARIFAAVRDRPWPPWGLGARHVSAVCQVHAIADESYAISPVYVTDEDLTNIGLIAAVYKEVLESLAVSKHSEINYLVADGSSLADHVLTSAGFRCSEDVFVTEQARYHTYRAPADKLLHQLGLADVATPDLLAHEFPPGVFERNALYHPSILNASKAEWAAVAVARAAEVLRLPRGGHAGKPGGVPSGTNRWGYPEVADPVDLFFVSLDNFIGDRRSKLVDFALEREGKFRPATIVEPRGDKPTVDERLRRAKTLDELESFEAMFAEKIKEVLEPVLARLKRPGFPLGRIEMQITASGDGDYFRMHRDGGDTSTRELSFVYFFHREPRRFSGGELRLFDNEPFNDKVVPTDRSHTLSPRQDVILFFTSRTEHEVLPVRVPTKAFGDSRFTVNGWIHRAQ